MPQSKEQRKLDDFFSKSPVKVSKKKHQSKKQPEQVTKPSPAIDVVTLDDSESDWDAGRSKLAPSSPVKSPTGQTDDDSEEAPVELSPLVKRQRLMAAARVVSDIETSGSEDHVPLNKTKKRKGPITTDSDDEQLQAPSKRRKTLKRGLKPTSDEENLMDELDTDVVLNSRLRAPAKKSAHTKALEQMKRKRLGLSPKSSSHSSEEDSSQSDTNEISQRKEAKFKPIPGSQRPGGSRTSPLEEDIGSTSSDASDFVVEDEEQVEVVLPIEYSAQRVQPLGHSFKVFLQFLVHIACQPRHLRAIHMKERLKGDNPAAEYWRNATKHLRRTLGSIRDSQVASTIWSHDFRKALETRPELGVIITEVEPYCHACRRSSALSTRQATLGGDAYNPEGFEPFEESSDTDSDESESSEEDAATTFNLGQHCARRVELFHAFTHWEYHLFKAIEEEITALETANREKLRGQEKKKKKKKKKHLVDTDDPDAIVDWLDKRNVIEMHWREIQNMMERAKKVEMRQPGDID